MFQTLFLFLFPIGMAFAASSDLLTMRISNKLVLYLIIGFACAVIWMGMPLLQIGWHLGAGMVVLAVAFFLFAMEWIGGGDAKLAAATALWIGMDFTLVYVVYSGFLGGALTLLILGLRSWPLPAGLIQVEWIARLHDKKSGVPYGIALAAAGLLTYPSTAIYLYFIA